MSDVPDWQGIAFDMDGTLVDTEHVHFDAWNEVFGRFDVGPFEQEWCATFTLRLLSRCLKRSCMQVRAVDRALGSESRRRDGGRSVQQRSVRLGVLV